MFQAIRLSWLFLLLVVLARGSTAEEFSPVGKTIPNGAQFIDHQRRGTESILTFLNPDSSKIEIPLSSLSKENQVTFRMAFGGANLFAAGLHEHAIILQRKAVVAMPDQAYFQNGLAWILATGNSSVRNGEQALKHAIAACRLVIWDKNERGIYADTLAAAYAETGRFDLAVAREELAIKEAEAKWHDEFQMHLKTYKEKKPWRDHAKPPSLVVPESLLKTEKELVENLAIIAVNDIQWSGRLDENLTLVSYVTSAAYLDGHTDPKSRATIKKWTREVQFPELPPLKIVMKSDSEYLNSPYPARTWEEFTQRNPEIAKVVLDCDSDVPRNLAFCHYVANKRGKSGGKIPKDMEENLYKIVAAAKSTPSGGEGATFGDLWKELSPLEKLIAVGAGIAIAAQALDSPSNSESSSTEPTPKARGWHMEEKMWDCSGCNGKGYLFALSGQDNRRTCPRCGGRGEHVEWVRVND